MDPAVIAALLYENESSTLDFKREQYPFAGATDEQKSELLKDLLAFANAWRRSDAYILVGVDEGVGMAQPVGVASHPDDAQLQQFVNSKTSRPVLFSYETAALEGCELGVYRIPLHVRPIFLKRDFGTLRKDTVYLRRGSSTAIADPDEIARMGAADALTERPTPRLELTWMQPGSGQKLGQVVSVKSFILQRLPAEALPKIRVSPHEIGFKNRDYFRELVEFVRQQQMLTALLLSVTNRSAVSADDVVVEIQIQTDAALSVLDQTQALERPVYEGFTSIHEQLAKEAAPPPDIQVEHLLEQWKITARFGRVRPQATVTTRNAVYFGASLSKQLQLEAVIYGHDFEPTRIPLAITIEVEQRDMTLQDLSEYAEQDVRE